MVASGQQPPGAVVGAHARVGREGPVHLVELEADEAGVAFDDEGPLRADRHVPPDVHGVREGVHQAPYELQQGLPVRHYRPGQAYAGVRMVKNSRLSRRCTFCTTGPRVPLCRSTHAARPPEL